MCVIIHKEPGGTVPFEKLKTACRINTHGYGLSIIDRGKVSTIRRLTDNDPDEVAKRLERVSKQTVFLHLRHATVGSVTEENSHPFILFQKKQDGLDLGFMHNGTLFDFKPAVGTHSDTYVFTNTFLLPLAQRVRAFVGDDGLLSDPLFGDILHKYAQHSSVFVLFDGNGRHLIVNKDRGAQFDGWWASNDYSFKETHARFTGVQPNTSRTWGEWSAPPSWVNPNLASKSAAESATVLWNEDAETEVGCKTIGAAVKEKTTVPAIAMLNKLEKSRTPFVKLAGLDSLRDLGKLPQEEWVKLCDDYPAAMAVAFMDLLVVLRERDETIAALKEKVSK